MLQSFTHEDMNSMASNENFLQLNVFKIVVQNALKTSALRTLVTLCLLPGLNLSQKEEQTEIQNLF